MVIENQPLVITPGDPAGIGAEITWKAIQKNHSIWRKKFPLLCIGSRDAFTRVGAKIIPASSHYPCLKTPFVWLLEAPNQLPSNKRSALLGGYQSGWSIQKACELIQQKKALAIITGPIHKARLQKGGFPFVGHTDFLAFLSRKKNLTMMLANDSLRVSLVSVHCGVQKISEKITSQSLRNTLLNTQHALHSYWNIRKPKIDFLSLNPHAGEDGLLGLEEKKTIYPFIKRHSKVFNGILRGPFPSDTYFARYLQLKKKDRPDAVIAMYHDQGLIPVKMIDFDHTINVTLGLPWIRTSVDHGTAFDISGKNRANPSSMIAAVNAAMVMIKNQHSLRIKGFTT